MKQAIVVRKDLKMSKGKCAAQVAHGAVEASLMTLKRDKRLLERWKEEGMKKVVLGVADLKELLELKNLAEKLGIVHYLVRDAGKTEVPAGTETALAIGPDEDEKIDLITGKLKAL